MFFLRVGAKLITSIFILESTAGTGPGFARWLEKNMNQTERDRLAFGNKG